MRSPTTDVAGRVAAGAPPVEHQLARRWSPSTNTALNASRTRGERVRGRDHRRVDAGGDALVAAELGDREQLHHVAEPRGELDVLGVTRAMPSRYTSAATTRALNAIDARIAHFAAASSPRRRPWGPPPRSRGAGPRRAPRRTTSRSSVILREDEVRRAVHDAHHPAEPLAGERLLQRPDQRDAAADGRLEVQVEALRVGGVEQLAARGGEQLLVRGDDRLARARTRPGSASAAPARCRRSARRRCRRPGRPRSRHRFVHERRTRRAARRAPRSRFAHGHTRDVEAAARPSLDVRRGARRADGRRPRPPFRTRACRPAGPARLSPSPSAASTRASTDRPVASDRTSVSRREGPPRRGATPHPSARSIDSGAETPSSPRRLRDHLLRAAAEPQPRLRELRVLGQDRAVGVEAVEPRREVLRGVREPVRRAELGGRRDLRRARARSRRSSSSSASWVNSDRSASSIGRSSTPRSAALRRIDAIRAWPYCT